MFKRFFLDLSDEILPKGTTTEGGAPLSFKPEINGTYAGFYAFYQEINDK